jgi:hypothetical protein
LRARFGEYACQYAGRRDTGDTGPLIGDREPIVLHKEIPGMGRAKRYIITIADDDRGPLDKICRKLITADATCDVLRNPATTN